jgi:gliding motility-associated-like protein
VRDANGCIANISNEITIDPLPELEILLVSTNPLVNCVGDNTGTIEATAQGGLGNYTYILQDTMGNTIPAVQNSPGIFTELEAGSYVVYVESGDCNAISEGITITEPETALEVEFEKTDIICFGDNNGRLVILATGGTGIIKYAISPQLNQFFETNIFENLGPGIYDVIVQDELGCFEVFDFEITEPEQVLINIVQDTIIPEICDGDINGSFIIEVQGGTPPYSVSLDDYNGNYITGTIDQTAFEFSNLGGGNHIVYVRDSVGCESEWVITFPESVFINAMVEIENECVDNNVSNRVAVSVSDSVSPSDLEYSLNDGPFQASNEFINLPPSIDNYILVRHVNGCEVMTAFFDIETYNPVTLLLNNGTLNEIEAIASGGSGVYQYTFNEIDYGNTNTFIIGESGTYEVIVTDSNGCTARASITLFYIELCLSNYFTPNGDGIADFWSPGCIESYPNLMFAIYDRYGRKVAMLRAGEKWDGRYNGTELPTGDYWYVINLNQSNEREFVGHFTLYR